MKYLLQNNKQTLVRLGVKKYLNKIRFVWYNIYPGGGGTTGFQIKINRVHRGLGCDI